MKRNMQYLGTKELDKMSARNLPIKTGDGMGPDTAYILRDVTQFEAPSLEHLIIDLTLKASGYLFWVLDLQTFTIENDREIDYLKVSAMKNDKAEVFGFYFDLTEL